MSFAEVLLDLPLPHPLQYRLTPEQQAVARVGMRCVAPVGQRLMLGVLIGLPSKSSIEQSRLRPLRALLDDPLLSPEWLHFCQFAAAYYHQPLAQVVLGALPPTLRRVPGPRSAAQLARWRRAAPPFVPGPSTDRVSLRQEQRHAIEAIARARGGFSPFLLHGVTGSGKTEVYLGAIAAALESDPNAQALWLVPEINLTPQFEARLLQRFAHLTVVSLHSGLGAEQRTAAWMAAHEGRARIVLGTRLAVFASMPHLRIVIVDEEHDASFKASDGVRYSARDLAVKRAQLTRAAVVLGSATPSLESWQQALSGGYALLTLNERATAPASGAEAVEHTTRVHTLDLRRYPPQQGLSGPLRSALGQTLERNEQALVFINRRGYAPVLACEACGWLSACPNCSVHAAFHRGIAGAKGSLRCHHCGWKCPVPRACPTCGNQDLRPVGQGTQRVEEALRGSWPAARIGRLDRDTARHPRAAEETLMQVHAGELDLLVGTQMIAKGHDFRGVSLVVVLNADAQLIAADFRAPERLFALLMQVAGRAGRSGQPAQVLVQTRFPDHPLYRALARGDYAQFAREQLAERRAARMPPFTHHALLTATAGTMSDALQFLSTCRQLGLDTAHESVALYEPVPMPLARMASELRAQLLIEAPRRAPLHRFLQEWLERVRTLKLSRRLRWQIDVDPLAI